MVVIAGRELFRGRRAQGTTKERLEREEALQWTAAAGQDGQRALQLHDAVERGYLDLPAMSAVTTPLAADHVRRLARVMPVLDAQTGLDLARRGYTGHLLVEDRPAAFGATGQPPIMDLPPLGANGQPRRDLPNLLLRAVQQRSFEQLRTVPSAVWEGFTVCTTWRIHDDIDDEEGEGPALFPSREVIDGVLRFGWVLRVADVTYGLEPPQRP